MVPLENKRRTVPLKPGAKVWLFHVDSAIARAHGYTVVDEPEDADVAIIRAEANLARIPADLEKLAVRVIHACGMVDAIDGLQFSPGAGKAGRDPWNAADDLVLRKIAQAGLSGLTGMINGGPPAPAPTGLRGPAVASADAPTAPTFAALSYTDH